MDPIRHRFQVALSERPVLALLGEKNEEDVAVVLGDGHQIVTPGLHASHLQNQILEDVAHLIVDAAAVIVLDLSEVRGVDEQQREAAVRDQHRPDLVHPVSIAGDGGGGGGRRSFGFASSSTSFAAFEDVSAERTRDRGRHVGHRRQRKLWNGNDDLLDTRRLDRHRLDGYGSKGHP